MAKIVFIVIDFASHRTWAEGYQRIANHDLKIIFVPSHRWKWRMLTSPIELLWDDSNFNTLSECDTIIIDGMFDITVLIAYLSKKEQRIPKILVYMHENQLTTPFTSQDRDVKRNTHWHYGLSHWRSLMVADGFLFNTQQHLSVFSDALPKLIKEQCPVEIVDQHLEKAHDMMKSKCTVLRYGLDLDDSLILTKPNTVVNPPSQTEENEKEINSQIPVLLWNARLEEDKDPESFFRLLHQLRNYYKTPRNNGDTCVGNNNGGKMTTPSFQLIVLGTDPTKEKKYFQRFQKEFSSELLHLGWCTDRASYRNWLQKADIIISTARHETFGIAIVESIWYGKSVLPLLPNRLSYPELFEQQYLYSSPKDCLAKLSKLIQIVKSNDLSLKSEAHDRIKCSIAHYRWSVMGPIYDDFFHHVVAKEEGTTISEIGQQYEEKVANEQYKSLHQQQFPKRKEKRKRSSSLDSGPFVIITEANDPRIALYRPKSLRNYRDYNQQLTLAMQESIIKKQQPSLHGGRRAMVRMLEALSQPSSSSYCCVQPISFLTTHDLADKYLLKGIESNEKKNPPIYVVSNKELLDEIRGQKLNAGDAVLSMLQFPIPAPSLSILESPFILLENVRNAENVGSILRTAFCLGITSIVASPTAWAALRDSRAARCSMGTIYYHKFYKSSNLVDSIKEIRQQQEGIQIYGIEIGPGAQPVTPHPGEDKNWGMVLGNEDVGLTNEVRTTCDKLVFVPQKHGDSLNVGHAAAITMFQLGYNNNKHVVHDGTAACT